MDFSLVASTFRTLRLRPPSKLTLLEAETLSSAHVPPFPADIPALLTGIDSRELALKIKSVLMNVYPPAHILQVVQDGNVKDVKLGEFENFSSNTCVYIPSLGEGTSFESF